MSTTETPPRVERAGAGTEGFATMTYREALRLAMREEMLRDERVFVMGEEVGVFDGAYKVTAGLLAIVCIGETESQRADGDALSICGGQIVASVPTGMTEADLAIGYEPLWAIGSGKMPTSQEIVQMHAHIRRCLVEHLGTEGRSVRILYGGSVKPPNARAILALPAGYREAVVLCDLHELSYQDAAHILGCAVGTVRSRLHRARALLSEKLAPTKVRSNRCLV